ncbi:MAG: proton-conducting transporter membrane subunit [Caldilineaceae bacterium]
MTLSPNWLAAPIVIPMLTAALSLAFTHWNQRVAVRRQRNLAAIAIALNLVVALLLLGYTLSGHRLVLQMGGWAAPFGITVIADGLTAILLTLTGLMAAAILPFAVGALDQRERMSFYPLLLFLLMGVNGAYLAGDLFNLYVFFEVLLMSSFVLLTLGGQAGQINGGIRYVVLNLLASTLFLAAAGLAYGALGTLNMAHLALRIPQAPQAVQTILAGLLLIAFGSKAALFPLFFWLPSSYHTPHPAVTAFFGGVLTKVGIYALFRTFSLLFPDYLSAWQGLILTVAGFTMLSGVLGAMAVGTLRRVLSFHIISQVGYMVMGLGLAGSANPTTAGFGMAAGILYLVHHMLVKTALLMAGGAAELEVASGSLLQTRLSGLMGRRPILAAIFFVAAFSLAGIPPSSGFISKLSLLQGALQNGNYIIAAVSLLVSALTLMSMVRLWQHAFWGHSTEPIYPTAPLTTATGRWLTLGPIAALLALSLSIGLFGAPVLRWSTIAAQQALDRNGYIQAVSPTDEIIFMGDEHHE